MGNTSAKPHPRPRNKKQVHWKAVDRPARPGKPQLVSDTEATPDVINIRWDRPPKDGGSAITGYLVEHRRTGSPHWVRATPLLVLCPELALSGLEPGWRYQFRVSAENAVGMSDPSELSEPLTVTLQRSAVTSPRFTQELADTTALENEKVEFVVYFLGQPTPKICWYKDGFEIFSSRRIRITTESDRSVLTIHQSQLVDAGEIKCTATNKAGHASTKSMLTLEAAPSIRLPRQYEDGLLFEIGEVIRLKITVDGLPTPLVCWSHDGESIQNDERYEIENGDKSSTLKIGEARRTDRGEYRIKAMNKLGEDTASFLVTVTDKPSPPGRAQVVMTLGRSVTLAWNTPVDDGGCKIGNYIIEYYRLGWDVWLKAATSRQLTTMLGELIEGSQYKFRVKAESPYGVSEPGEESDILFIPDTKRGIIHPTQRSASQPRDNEAPVLPLRKKPRSQSSSRVDTAPTHINPNTPLRPERNKIKSPPKTPEPSPRLARREFHDETINIFDRSSMTRDLAYGSPEIKLKKSEITIHPPQQIRSPSPAAQGEDKKRQKSASPKAMRRSPSPNVPSPRFGRKLSTSNAETERNSNPTAKSRSPSPNMYGTQSSPRFGRRLSRGNTETGSSEFMLVLLPNEHKDHNTSGGEFHFEDNLIPPPLSLSAPELGTEPPSLMGLKYSASSTELLHERAMIRFYEAAEAEEANLKKDLDAQQRKHSAIPKIQINNQDEEDAVGLERKMSLRRRYSAGITAPQQVLWTQRRHSLRNSADLNDILDAKLRKFPLSVEEKREIMMNRKRSESEEKEEEEFERVRARMTHNRAKLSHRKAIDVVDVDRWEAEMRENEYEESLSEEETESSSDERIYDQVPDAVFGEQDEDSTYHPRSMVAKNSEPFEILTKPKKMPDSNFVPKPILKRNAEGFRENRQRSQSLAMATRRNEEVDLLAKRGSLPFNVASVTEQMRRGSSPVGESTKIKSEKSSRSHHISAIASISGIAAAGIILPQPLLAKKKSDEEARVAADHYADIVRNYSQKKKMTPTDLRTAKQSQMIQKRELTPEDVYTTKQSQIIQKRELTPEDVHTTKQSQMTQKRELTPEDIYKTRQSQMTQKREQTPEHKQPQIIHAPKPNIVDSNRLNGHDRSRYDSESSSQGSVSSSKPRFRRGSPAVLNKDIYIRGRDMNTSPPRTTTPSKSPGRLKRNDPSPMRDFSTQTRYSPPRKSPSPAPVIRTRPPKMKEIMTQTSKSIDMFINDATAKITASFKTWSDKDLKEYAENRVRTTIDYLTDLAMFAVACWLYVFDNELLAIPVLLVMVYRQLQDEVRKRIPKWMLPKPEQS